MAGRPLKEIETNSLKALIKILPKNTYFNARQLYLFDNKNIYKTYRSYQLNLDILVKTGFLSKKQPLTGNICTYERK